VASYFERLDREESAVRDRLSGLHEELERVHKQIGEAEERLRRFAITRETLESLPADIETPGAPEAPDVPEAGEVADPPMVAPEETGAPAVPEMPPGPMGPLGWEEGRRQMLSLLATAGRAMKAREIAAAIGEDVSTPARVETTRGRLKKLADEGHVVEGPVGWFAIAADSGKEPAREG
jgi:hypothetical protein